MAITDYGGLKEAVAQWLHRDNLDSVVGSLISIGEAGLFRKLRIRAMEYPLSATISAGTVALPTDYVAMKVLRVEGSTVQKLDRKPIEWIWQAFPIRSAQGVPKFFARYGDSLEFGPYPDSDYALTGRYYRRLPPLSDSNATNWFIQNAPDLLLMAALAEAAPYLKNDARIVVWQTKLADLIDQVQAEEIAEEASGSSLSGSAA